MLELRYNGCADCLTSCKKVMANNGFFPSRDYIVDYHDNHRDDAVYKKRPDYLEIFSGAILYNPDTKHWIDFYDNEHIKRVLGDTPADRQLIKDLINGK